MSIGLEVRENILPVINDIYKEGMHLQVTIPNFIAYSKIQSIIKGKKVIAHSNLLNVTGENDFRELKKYIPQIQSLKAASVIEHFTELVDKCGNKRGIHIPKEKSDQEIIEVAEKNLLKWKGLLGVDIALENAAVTEDVLRYFTLLRDVQNITDCPITIDVPHLIISYYSLKSMDSKDKLIKIVRELRVDHIHLAGVSARNGMIEDNHYLPNFELVLSYAQKWFPECPNQTIEQGPTVSFARTSKCLELLKNKKSLIFIKDFLPGLSTPKQKDVNKDLAENGFFGLTHTKKGKAQQKGFVEDIDIKNPFYYFEKYNPFFYPIKSMKKATSELNDKEFLFASTLFAKWGLKFLSWTHPEIDNVNLLFGKDEETIFRTGINVLGKKTKANNFAQYDELLFESPQRSWVRIQVPKPHSKGVFV